MEIDKNVRINFIVKIIHFLSIIIFLIMSMGPLGGFICKVKLKKFAERGIENGLYGFKSYLKELVVFHYITLNT